MRDQRLGLFKITKAAITPGIHPQMVSSKTIRMEPQPLSRTDRGGNIIARRTLQKLIGLKLRLLHRIGRCKSTFVTCPIFLSSSVMRIRLNLIGLLWLLSLTACLGQFRFEGQLGEEWQQGKVYLSLIEDYRKTHGVYPDQVVAMSQPDSLGFFFFEGDYLPAANRIYRIHVDQCDEADANGHFLGHCLNSKQLIFVANNRDTLSLPLGFEQQLFCEIVSTNTAASALMRVDSVMQDMAYDMGPQPSVAARKLKAEKWIKDLQETAKNSNEPLAELYAYGIISDRTGELREQYLKGVSGSPYYQTLLSRLRTEQADAPFTKQFETELRQDASGPSVPTEPIPAWAYVLLAICGISLFLNMHYIKTIRGLKAKPVTFTKLSSQEQKVLELIQRDKTNKEIAEALFVSVSTVKTHINNLYKKLGVQSREEVKQL